MNERAILEQRIVTLRGLLDTPGGPLGGSGGRIAVRLHHQWSTEQHLLERILAEAPGDEVSPTLDVWARRTAEFINRAPDERPAWTDRQGQEWDAEQVLELVLDIQERLSSWSLPDDFTDGDGADNEPGQPK